MGVGLDIYCNSGHQNRLKSEIKKKLDMSQEPFSLALNFLGKVKIKKGLVNNWVECGNIGESIIFKYSNSDLWIEFQKESCSIHLKMNWFYFLDNRKTREAIRSLTREVVWACGGNKAFYLPSTNWSVSDSVGNAFSDSFSFKEMESQLISNTLKFGNFFHQPVAPHSIRSESFRPWTHEAFPFLVDVFLQPQ